MTNTSIGCRKKYLKLNLISDRNCEIHYSFLPKVMNPSIAKFIIEVNMKKKSFNLLRNIVYFLGLVFIIICLQMMRLRGQQQGQQQRALSEQEFLDFFYTKLNVSNFKDRIKTEADALRYCQLSGILPTRDSPLLIVQNTPML